MNRPQLGQMCNVGVRACKSSTRMKGKTYTTWYKSPTLNKGEQAMYIGYRTVHEGVTTHDYDDDGNRWVENTFKHSCSHILWLFVSSERLNPFYAFPEDVEFEAVTT